MRARLVQRIFLLTVLLALGAAALRAGGSQPGIDSVIVDLGIGGATPRHLAVDAWTGHFVIAADEGYQANKEDALFGARSVATARVPMFRMPDGSWEPGYPSRNSCDSDSCRAVDLETGGFDASGTLLAAVVRGNGEGRAVLIGLEGDGRFLGFSGAAERVLATAPSPAVPSFVVLLSDRITTQPLRTGSLEPAGTVVRWPTAWPAPVRRAVFALRPDHSDYAVASGDSIALIIADAPDQAKLFAGPGGKISRLVWRSDGSRFAVGTEDGWVACYEARAETPFWAVRSHGKKGVTGLGFDPAGQLLFSVGEDETLRAYSASDGKEVLVYKAKRNLQSVVVHPDSGAVATLERASKPSKLGLASTSIGMYVLFPAKGTGLEALMPAEDLTPIAGLPDVLEAWARMRICTRVLRMEQNANHKSAEAVTGLRRGEFETAEEFDERRRRAVSAAASILLGPRGTADVHLARNCVADVGKRFWTTAQVVAKLGTYDLDAGHFPVTIVGHPPGPSFEIEGVLPVDREIGRTLREASSSYPVSVTYQLVPLPPLMSSGDEGRTLVRIGGVEDFGMRIQSARLGGPDHEDVPSMEVSLR